MTTWNDYTYHKLPGGGMGDGDDAQAMAEWEDNAQGEWRLAAWSKSPATLQAEAAAMNASAFGSVNAAAGKHSQPPVPPHLRHL